MQNLVRRDNLLGLAPKKVNIKQKNDIKNIKNRFGEVKNWLRNINRSASRLKFLTSIRGDFEHLYLRLSL